MTLFGHLDDGTEVHSVTLKAGNLRATFLSYGTILQSLELDGHPFPLVLGYNDLDHYLTDSPYFGATAGRYANRIRDGHLCILGETYQLNQNFIGKHCLHGGMQSIGKKPWQLDDYTEDSVRFSIQLEDGEMGFPGNMGIQAKFQLLAPGTLDITYTATTDATTICNLAHHSYFNLSGEDDILQHQLQVNAEAFLPVNDELIPTGEIQSLDNHLFDFRQAKSIGSIPKDIVLDHNFCSQLTSRPKHIATLYSPASGVEMQCLTTEPGIQVYTGAKINTQSPGLMGKAMGAYAGIALEPQLWPDANHHPHFPNPVLLAGETYYQKTQYVFAKVD